MSEWEKERGSVSASESVCVCVTERDKARECERVCMSEQERESVCSAAALCSPATASSLTPERECLIDNLLVRIHLIIEIILVDRPCAMGI